MPGLSFSISRGAWIRNSNQKSNVYDGFYGTVISFGRNEPQCRAEHHRFSEAPIRSGQPWIERPSRSLPHLTFRHIMQHVPTDIMQEACRPRVSMKELRGGGYLGVSDSRSRTLHYSHIIHRFPQILFPLCFASPTATHPPQYLRVRIPDFNFLRPSFDSFMVMCVDR
jgi:hypothetical protein